MAEERPTLVAGADWASLSTRARRAAPEAFGPDGAPLNLIQGEWKYRGRGKAFLSPVDGSTLGSFPRIDLQTARLAVRGAASAFSRWSRVDLDERRRRVTACLDRLREHRELLAFLLVWEIGKPYEQALTSVDRCISGVEWYVQNIEPMLAGREALGLISNIASWNYPMSVLMHALLVQMLAGNTVIAKTPSDGGLFTLTVAVALAAREHLPVTLVSGSGGELSDALVRNDDIAGLSFVGGKSSGRDVAASLYDRNKRYMLEMEGVNGYGVWHFSDWERLAGHIKKGFEYGKQRCTAYPRFVVERRLFPKFLETYTTARKAVTFGHPLLVKHADDAPPKLTYGPLINDRVVEDLRTKYSEALGLGAVGVAEGSIEDGVFFPGQDVSAYLPPLALMNVPHKSRLYHSEPFGPVDTFVVVDSEEELIAEMNVSNGALVATIACDHEAEATALASELRAFKVGINQLRSRGDREEAFGGVGASWKGCFVGGEHLVRAVTRGPDDERLHGNFPDGTHLPDRR
ncbi:MAG: Betaine aldehyde dehydrogenase [Acidimicrobiaceae bacterium]|nr:Betaine aldehyde dehydrogenase [Acidimicrobiaceae bacterium]